MLPLLPITALTLALLAACGAYAEPIELKVGDRVAPAFLPFDPPEGPMPVVVMLHGYGTTGPRNDRYLGLSEAAAARGVATIVPEGTQDEDGERFWNAFDSCCDFDGSEVDDVGFILGLIDALGERVAVDPTRVYLVGYSNGGFMAFRAACDHPERFAAIAPIVGALDGDPAACAPSLPVSLLHIRAVDDQTIRYDGGEIEGFPYESAQSSASRWAALSGCGDAPEDGEARDLLAGRDGDETTAQRWPGCPSGVDVELWSMQGAGHIPRYRDEAPELVLDFLLAHQRAP